MVNHIELCRRRKLLLLTDRGGRTARPACEGMTERGRSLVTEQPGNLLERNAWFFDVLEREASPQVIDNLLVGCALSSQSTCDRSLTDPQGQRHRLPVRLPVRQQLLNFVLDCSLQRPGCRIALPCRFIAKRLQRLQ